MGEEFYTVNEIASSLKVHQVTVRRWIESGKLKASKIQGVVRVTKEDYLKFIQAV